MEKHKVIQKETYKGWTCIHSEEGLAKIEAEKIDTDLDSLVYEISLLSGAKIQIMTDQWSAIVVDGEINNWELEDSHVADFRTQVSCDRIMDGLIHTRKIWVEKWEELTGRDFG